MPAEARCSGAALPKEQLAALVTEKIEWIDDYGAKIAGRLPKVCADFYRDKDGRVRLPRQIEAAA